MGRPASTAKATSDLAGGALVLAQFIGSQGVLARFNPIGGWEAFSAPNRTRAKPLTVLVRP